MVTKPGHSRVPSSSNHILTALSLPGRRAPDPPRRKDSQLEVEPMGETVCTALSPGPRTAPYTQSLVTAEGPRSCMGSGGSSVLGSRLAWRVGSTRGLICSQFQCCK